MATTAKQAARELIEHLPDQASWDDIMYHLYVKEKIEIGQKAVEEGRTIPHEQIKTRLMNRKNR
jgi:hypothetical protein